MYNQLIYKGIKIKGLQKSVNPILLPIDYQEVVQKDDVTLKAVPHRERASCYRQDTLRGNCAKYKLGRSTRIGFGVVIAQYVCFEVLVVRHLGKGVR